MLNHSKVNKAKTPGNTVLTGTPAFFKPALQFKLSVNEPNDAFEKEADAVADKVMRMPGTKGIEPHFFQPKPLPVTAVQGKCNAFDHKEKLQRKGFEEEEETINLKPAKEFDKKRKCSHCEKEENIQGKAGNADNEATAAPTRVTDVINSSGQQLDGGTRGFMESRFGYDFSKVQIHNDSQAHQSSSDINALAYTHQNQIVFGEGQYHPYADSGKHLLAHELTHVVQQNNGSPGGMRQAKNLVQCEIADADTEKNAFEELALGSTSATSIKPEYLPYAVKEINRMGKMASDIKSYKDVKTTGKIIRNIPDPASGKEVARIKYNELIIVKASNASSDWLYVTTTDGRQGWTQRIFVAENIPDQNATIYHTPNREALEPILANHYRAVDPYPIKTGDDLRILAMAIYIANVQDGRVGLNKDQLEADFKTSLKDLVDPWNEENRKVYRSLRVTASNVWLPGSQYINTLKDQGIISTRPDWMNVVIDTGKAIIGFNAGLIAGFFGGIWDMLEGLYELARDLVKLIGSVFSGAIIDDLKGLYDDITGLTVDKAIEMVKGVFAAIWDELKNFYNKWTAENTWDKWFFRGEVIGLICLEIVLFLLSGGAANAVKWVAKLAKFAPKLARFLQKLITKIDDVLPGKMKKKHGEPGDTDITPDNDRNREKLTALSLAKGITEVNDAKDTDVDLLILSLQPIALKYKVKFDYTSTGSDTYDIDMIASRKRVKTRYTAPKKIITAMPFKSLRGKSLKYIKRNKPSGWQTSPTRDHEGFIWTDTKGTERLRYMRGKDHDIKWVREKNGYFRWQNEGGQFLDIDGNAVLPADPDFQFRTHIAYEGLPD